MLKHTFYRFEISYDPNFIIVKLSAGFAKDQVTLFHAKEGEIQRGLVGFGSTSLKGTFFHALEVENLLESLKPEKRDYEESLGHVNPSYIHSQCQMKFQLFGKEAVEKCASNIYQFCKDECDKSINATENVLE